METSWVQSHAFVQSEWAEEAVRGQMRMCVPGGGDQAGMSVGSKCRPEFPPASLLRLGLVSDDGLGWAEEGRPVGGQGRNLQRVFLGERSQSQPSGTQQLWVRLAVPLRAVIYGRIR